LTTVSVILPTLNERAFIRDCLASLQDQNHELLEILVVDGGSTDGTVELALRAGAPVSVLTNPKVTAAAALNTGLEAAKGEVVVRADAHTLYDKSYVRRCVDGLEEPGVVNVGGPMRAHGSTRFGRAIAAVTSSPLGVGPGRFHYARAKEDVDTVYLGAWRRSDLIAVGGWDEDSLQWGAEDHELNLRLRTGGGRIVLDPDIRSAYFVRETRPALRRQYFNYGLGKASTLRKHGTLPSWRPLVPAALVGATAAAAVLGRGLGARVFVPVVHGLFCAWAARRIAARSRVSPVDAFVATAICHWSYGAGLWAGLARILVGRPFEARPQGHR